jgi:methylmalonyl-CoA/ethylmalonyl-CoA epimerase
MNLANATVGQLLVPVDDLAKGISFYRDVLGLPFLFEAPPQMAFFNCGGIRLLVGVPPPGQAAQRGSAIHFRVPEIGRVFSSLKGAGVAFSAEPHVVHKTPSMELWLAEFQDPFGNSLALMSEVKAGGV